MVVGLAFSCGRHGEQRRGGQREEREFFEELRWLMWLIFYPMCNGIVKTPISGRILMSI
jgi:hypothetical protein